MVFADLVHAAQAAGLNAARVSAGEMAGHGRRAARINALEGPASIKGAPMRNILLACLAGAALSAGGAALAQPADLQQACSPDVKKYCADVQPGGGRIMQCMKSHASDLSDACKAALAAHRNDPHRAQGGGAAGQPG